MVADIDLVAAMEPPKISGMTRRQPLHGVTGDHAAMEPAGDRRDEVHPVIRMAHIWAAPQWGPPMNGGTTVEPGGAPGHTGLTAMEPAGHRRDDRMP
jgi:hypothetical protein